jgi:hypothetical protein
MDISIACSDRSQTPELQPGETAAPGRIVAEPAETRGAGFVVERRARSAVRRLLAGVGVRISASAHPPIVVVSKAAHRDTT